MKFIVRHYGIEVGCKYTYHHVIYNKIRIQNGRRFKYYNTLCEFIHKAIDEDRGYRDFFLLDEETKTISRELHINELIRIEKIEKL